MKTVTFPDWIIEFLSSLPIGGEALVVIPVIPAIDDDFEAPDRNKDGRWFTCENRPPDVLNTWYLDCPLGAIGERVAVVHPDDWAAAVYAGTSKGRTAAYVTLTAEPEVKRVGETTEEEAQKAGCEPCPFTRDNPAKAAPGGCMCHLFDAPRPRVCTFAANWDHPWPDAWARFCWVKRV